LGLGFGKVAIRLRVERLVTSGYSRERLSEDPLTSPIPRQSPSVWTPCAGESGDVDDGGTSEVIELVA
jgi:hypothetical protein